MKRSAQVALVLMGATAVGASSYALAPRTDCVPPGSAASRPPAVAPGTGQPGEPCRETRRSSSSGYSRWGSSGSSTWRRSSTQTSTSTALRPSGAAVPSTGRSGTTTVARGGFGSTGHGFSSGS